MIKAPSSKWKTFVANRVAEIQNLTSISEWNHVKSQDNPVDLISRGLTSSQIIRCALWWHGPKWLSENPLNFQPDCTTTILECRSAISVTVNLDELNLFSNISPLKKLKVIVAYCLRFINNCTSSKSKRTGELTGEEITNALCRLIHLCQFSAYHKEIADIKNNKTLNAESKILSLNPFLDKDNILRVGGRIYQSNFDYSKKHPIILPPSHALAKLIVKHEYIHLLDCGPTMLLASVRENYWPIGGRNLVKRVTYECITCFRANPKVNQRLMGASPKERL